jgi:MATE family multidrug resistance protein
VQPVGTVKEESRRLVSLAWPVVLSSLGMTTMSFVDFLVAGRLGEVSMGAVGIGHGISFALLIPAMGTAHGVDPLVAQAFGAGRPARAGAAAEKGAIWLALIGLVVMAGHLFAAPLLGWLRQDPSLVPEAALYCRISAASVPPFVGFLLVRQLLQGNGLMRPAMWAVLVANAVNLVVDVGLGLGVGPFPQLGVQGIAWATVAVRWAMFAVLLAVAITPLRRAWPTPEERARLSLLEVGRIALPVGLHSSVEAWAFVAAGLVAGSLGATAAAAHTAAINVASMAFMVALGIGAAAATRVGNLVGAGLPWSRSAWLSVGMAAAIMSVSAGLFATVPEGIARMYTPEPAVVALVAAVLPLAAAFQWFDGAQAVAFGVLRGLGDTRVPSVLALVSFWGLSVPLQVVLAHTFGWGLFGVWTGLVVGLGCISVALLLRMRWFAAQPTT